jgi:hypothetical protein
LIAKELVKSLQTFQRHAYEFDSHPVVFYALHTHQIIDRSSAPELVVDIEPEILPSHEAFPQAQPTATRGQVENLALGHSRLVCHYNAEIDWPSIMSPRVFLWCATIGFKHNGKRMFHEQPSFIRTSF